MAKRFLLHFYNSQNHYLRQNTQKQNFRSAVTRVSAAEKLLLMMFSLRVIELFDLIFRLTGHVDTELFEGLLVRA